MAHKIDGHGRVSFTEAGDVIVTLSSEAGDEIHMVIDEWIASSLALEIVKERLEKQLTYDL